AWSLGVEGEPLVWLDDGLVDNPEAVASEIDALPDHPEAILIVDDFDRMSPENRARVERARERGVRVILDSTEAPSHPGLEPSALFEVPPLSDAVASELVLRAVPSLTPKVVKRLLEVSDSRPGPLERLIQRIAAAAV